MGLAADSLAHEVNAVAHIVERIDAIYLEYVGLVGGKVGVGLDGTRNFVEVGAFLQLDIHHAAMDALANGDGHRQSVLDTGLRTHANAMPH